MTPQPHPSSEPEKLPPIVVVGAGAAGLTTAVGVAHHGYPVVVVDAVAKGHNGTRASVVHSHTLGQLESIDAANDIIDFGYTGKGPRIVFDKETVLQFDFPKYLADYTDHHTLVQLSQHDYERIMTEKLQKKGIKVEWNRRVVGFQHTTDGLGILFEDGEVMAASFIIGADGTRSTIRELAGLKFAHPETGELYWNPKKHESQEIPNSPYITLADAYIEHPLPPLFDPNHVNTNIVNGLVLVVAPIPPPKDAPLNTSFWRLAMLPPWVLGTPPVTPDRDFIQKAVDGLNPWHDEHPIKVHSVGHTSRYQIREAIASSMFAKVGQARILLVGDSAHCHTPSSGQGLNLAICDGIAASVAIDAVIKADSQTESKEQGDKILEDFSERRMMIARYVIQLSGDMTRSIIAQGSPWRKAVTGFVFRHVFNRLDFVKFRFGWIVSGMVNEGSAKRSAFWNYMFSFVPC